MMYKRFICASICLLTLVMGCSKSEDENPAFAGKIYNHLFFDSEEECMEAQPDPEFFINCAQQLNFRNLEEADIMLTDIMNRVTYSVNGNKVVVHPTAGSEFSSDIVFEIVDSNTLKRVDDGTIWKLQTGDSIWE